MNAQLVIPAAGMGRRLGAEEPKALVTLGDATLLEHTLRRFEACDLLGEAVVLCPPDYEKLFRKLIHRFFRGHAITLLPGGKERQESVERGLDALRNDTDIAVIHDAARPFVSLQAIRQSIEAAYEFGAATVAIPVVDTILQGDSHNFLRATPTRNHLWACQTPQCFRLSVIRHAHRMARESGFSGTDDASLVRHAGGQVKLVPGSTENFKITTPDDILRAELQLRKVGV